MKRETDMPHGEGGRQVLVILPQEHGQVRISVFDGPVTMRRTDDEVNTVSHVHATSSPENVRHIDVMSPEMALTEIARIWDIDFERHDQVIRELREAKEARDGADTGTGDSDNQGDR